jgi:hypothetical protein
VRISVEDHGGYDRVAVEDQYRVQELVEGEDGARLTRESRQL